MNEREKKLSLKLFQFYVIFVFSFFFTNLLRTFVIYWGERSENEPISVF